MDKEEALRIAERYAEIVAKEFQPKQIVFFGSYLYGTPHEYSDIDIAVIYDDYKGRGRWWDGAARLSALVREVDTSIEPHLLDLSDDPWEFAQKVMKIGKVLYPKE
ncbi:hypothetical protein R80B4_01688 [Fibrobacteres bacterium R8-0-B4]